MKSGVITVSWNQILTALVVAFVTSVLTFGLAEARAFASIETKVDGHEKAIRELRSQHIKEITELRQLLRETASYTSKNSVAIAELAGKHSLD